MSNEQTNGEQYLDTKEQVKRLTGLDTVYMDDSHRYAEDEKGRILVSIRSFEHVEDDIAQLLGEETILTKGEHQHIVNTALKDTFEHLGRYFDTELVNHLFPGLNVNNLNFYDFSGTRTKFFVLAQAAYLRWHIHLVSRREDNEEELYRNVTDVANAEYIGNRTFESKNVPDGYIKKIIVNLLDHPIVVIREKPLNRGFTREDLKVYLRIATIHEILHVMKCATGFTDTLYEGITHWYALQIALAKGDDVNNRKYTEKHGDNSTEAVAIMIHSLVEKGDIDLETIDRALLGNDEDARDKWHEALCAIYGQEATAHILTSEFSNATGDTTTHQQRQNFLRFVIIQESKRGGVYKERMQQMFLYDTKLIKNG